VFVSRNVPIAVIGDKIREVVLSGRWYYPGRRTTAKIISAI